MRVLVGCERFGRVRQAFRAAGHDAWSCDVVPAVDGSPHHLQCDVLTVLDRGWDLAIFHPDCKYLCNSGAKHLYLGTKKENGPDPERWRNMRLGAEFFRKLWLANIPRVAVENPIMLGCAKEIIGASQAQVVQPWMFGDPETKATCLWLRGLPLLIPTHATWPDCRKALGLPKDAKPKPMVHFASPGPQRHAFRSKTYPGLALAFAAQWGNAARGRIAA
jgi:hypothetical protein